MVEKRLSRAWAVLTLAATLALPATSEAQACAPVAPQLASMLGSTFGTPTTCARLDASGNSLQTTTTGLLIVRPDGTAIFASGDQHWALTDDGLESWIGNWHTGLYPPVSPASDIQTNTTVSAVAQVQPMTLLGFDRNQATALMRDDQNGSPLLVQIAGGCPDLPTTVGDHVFLRLRSDGTVWDLVLVRQHETCAVATLRAAEND
jgi:hypothetical protein